MSSGVSATSQLNSNTFLSLWKGNMFVLVQHCSMVLGCLHSKLCLIGFSLKPARNIFCFNLSGAHVISNGFSQNCLFNDIFSNGTFPSPPTSKCFSSEERLNGECDNRGKCYLIGIKLLHYVSQPKKSRWLCMLTDVPKLQILLTVQHRKDHPFCHKIPVAFHVTEGYITPPSQMTHQKPSSGYQTRRFFLDLHKIDTEHAILR